jgi:TolB protein
MSDETGKKSLYMMNADGSELKTIIKDINIVSNTVTWSPDGKKLLFTAKLPQDSYEQIYYVEAGENKTPVNITTSAGSKKRPVLTGDGRFLIYSSVKDNSYDIIRHDMVTHSETVLFGSPGNDISPAVTPDGTRVLFLSDEREKGRHNLYMVDVDGGSRIEITSGLNIEENSIRISPDNSMVSFIRFDNMGKKSVQVMNMNRSTVMISNDAYISAWSGNGKKLYYASFDPKNRKMVEYDVAGKTMKEVFKAEYKPGEESAGIKFIHFTDKLKEI